MVIKKEHAASRVTDPSLNRHHLHEVVTERDSQDWNGRYVQHRVELCDLTEDWNAQEVLVE